MIYELPSALYARAVLLFAETWMDGAFIWSALREGQEARLFVDDPTQPTAALLCRTFEYYVAGDLGATTFRRFIADAPAEVGVFARMYGYLPTNVPLAQTLLDDHAGRLIVVARRGFRWVDEGGKSVLARRRSPNDGVAIHRLDRTLAERVDRELHQTINTFWGGYERFLTKDFGFAALAGDELVSVAYAAAVGGGEANIDVITAERFRRRGLAARVCTAFIDHCQGHGLVATWDCDSDNAASAALARSLGFREGIPFAQLSTPSYVKLTESHGRWTQGAAAADGIIPWQQIEA
ncbi:MAG TPA: GNAT family N-acetyltransferase [Thermomicrobiales bacterium]